MKQNSTKNMILSHLVDIKAKIEQKSINYHLRDNLKTSTRADRQNASYVCTPSDLFFLDAFSHLYKRVCPSVRRSVRPSVRPSHMSWISDISTEMKQNSTKNMILSHLEDIKAKIEQKNINNIKLPFAGPLKDKYAGRSPERILCLYSVRLVSSLSENWAVYVDL